MFKITMPSTGFMKDMNNLVKYSEGFMNGVQQGRPAFLASMGQLTIEALKSYIDSKARMDPGMLHHVYEWYQEGSPSARLYEFDIVVKSTGVSLFSEFKQSQTVSKNSREPFYNKAYIMEKGIPVTIKPRRSSVLAFEAGGQTVFTKSTVRVNAPGGTEVVGSFERTIDEFITSYFSQAFLQASGIAKYLRNPSGYHRSFNAGMKSGRAVGVSAGYSWIKNATTGVTID